MADAEGLVRKREMPKKPAEESSPFERINHLVESLTVQHEQDREVYVKEKRGLPLTDEEAAQVARYRDTRRQLRQAKRDSGRPTLMAKLDFIVYCLFAVLLYYAVWYEYKIDLLPYVLNWLAPNFDHVDGDGNWVSDPDEL
eukprot:TRINITY_DN1970_c0_g1_i1.p1 TRINITY_DN1970_c0_g1~~TRINITY_DN1970_c0_g1_i1.p1  ORF type:complete len:141 (+),score=68.14 TRINITY_DN1970_c0_g1_i1:55-477(+)